jgi:hypothetical protein
VAEKKLIGRNVATHAAQVTIEQVRGGGQGIGPECGWGGGMKEHDAHAIV